MTWTDLLAMATSVDEVSRIVRDFLATWTPQELNALPRDCTPPHRFADPEEIVLYTFTLVEHQCHTNEDEPGLYRMAAFFSEATRHVTRLMSETPAEQAANNPIRPGVPL